MIDTTVVIAESLAGKRIAITGATGFVGTALVERLLRSVPGCELVLLIRAGKRMTAADRLRREILKNDAFDRLREELGGAAAFDEMAARRVRVATSRLHASGEGANEVDRIARADQPPSQKIEIEPPVRRAAERAIIEIEAIDIDKDPHWPSAFHDKGRWGLHLKRPLSRQHAAGG